MLCAVALWGRAVRTVLWVAGDSDWGVVLGSAEGGGASFADDSSAVEVALGDAVLGASSSSSVDSVGRASS